MWTAWLHNSATFTHSSSSNTWKGCANSSRQWNDREDQRQDPDPKPVPYLIWYLTLQLATDVVKQDTCLVNVVVKTGCVISHSVAVSVISCDMLQTFTSNILKDSFAILDFHRKTATGGYDTSKVSYKKQTKLLILYLMVNPGPSLLRSEWISKFELNILQLWVANMKIKVEEAESAELNDLVSLRIYLEIIWVRWRTSNLT